MGGSKLRDSVREFLEPPAVANEGQERERKGLRLLADPKLRTLQLKYLNHQRVKALQRLRTDISRCLKSGRDPADCPQMPEVRSRSIRVSDLRLKVSEPSRCKWCGDDLTDKNFSLTFDVPIDQGGSPEIENVVAICTSCFFHKGIYPQTFWKELIGWLKEDRRRLETYRQYSPTWARSSAFRRHWASGRAKRAAN
jgi:hypothetical protein